MTKPANLEYAFPLSWPERPNALVVAYRVVGTPYTGPYDELDVSLDPAVSFQDTLGGGDGSVGQYVTFQKYISSTLPEVLEWYGFDPFDPANQVTGPDPRIAKAAKLRHTGLSSRTAALLTKPNTPQWYGPPPSYEGSSWFGHDVALVDVPAGTPITAAPLSAVPDGFGQLSYCLLDNVPTDPNADWGTFYGGIDRYGTEFGGTTYSGTPTIASESPTHLFCFYYGDTKPTYVPSAADAGLSAYVISTATSPPPTVKDLIRAGLSPRQAKTWLRGDHSMKALLRGGFTRNQAKLLKEI